MSGDDLGACDAGFDIDWVNSQLARADQVWPPARYEVETRSTNADALAAAGAGAPPWTIVVADLQTAGRGRLDRSWEAAPGTALLASVTLCPPVAAAPESLGWIPLMVGMAVAAAVGEAGVTVGLKWPNDVVVDGGGAAPRKLSGILVERQGDWLAAGFGVNVEMDQTQLPVPTATSLLMEGASSARREQLLICAVTELRRLWDRWVAAGADADRAGLRVLYQAMSVTLGRRVAAALPNGEVVTGVAAGFDRDGHLIITTASGERMIAAGDVTHLRSEPED